MDEVCADEEEDDESGGGGGRDEEEGEPTAHSGQQTFFHCRALVKRGHKPPQTEHGESCSVRALVNKFAVVGRERSRDDEGSSGGP